MGFARFSKDKAELFERYRDGGLAEYIRAPYWLVDNLPDHVSFDVGAKAHELATALCTVKRANLEHGSTIIVTAPTGAVGSCIMKIAHLLGILCIVLVGRSSERLEKVAKLTKLRTEIVATDRLDQDWAVKRQLATQVASVLPHGADAVIDLTPNGTDMWQVLSGLKTGGTLVHLGGKFAPLPIPMAGIVGNCWTIVGTRNHSRGDALKILEWLREKEIDGGRSYYSHVAF